MELDLSKSQKVFEVQQLPTTKPAKRRRLVYKVAMFIFVFLVISALFFLARYVIAPSLRIYSYVSDIKSNVKSLANDFSNKNLSNLDIYLQNLDDNIYKINAEFDNFDFLKTLEATKGYYNNFQILKEILQKTSSLVLGVFPDLKNVMASSGFDVDVNKVLPPEEKSESENEEHDTFNLIMGELPLYLEIYDRSLPKILEITELFKSIDQNYVPELPGFSFRDDLLSIQSVLEDFPETSKKMVEFIKYVPALIGSETPVDYLVVLQNESELRGSGGLLTAYGNMRLEKGDFGDGISFIDMWDLQFDLWKLVEYGLIWRMPIDNIYGQSYLMNTGCGATESRAQDVGMYPDLYRSLYMFKPYYDLALQYNDYLENKYHPYQHMVIVNHAFAEKLLALVQPLEVEGFGMVTADTLFDFIKSDSDNQEKYSGFDPNRKQIVGKIAKEVKNKLFNLPIEKMPELISTLINLFMAKDISFASDDANMQAFFDQYGLTARTYNNSKGDYFQLNEAQNCALKLNKFVKNTVSHDVYIDPDGRIRKNIFVHWTQGTVYNESLYFQYSPTLQWAYRSWVRLFMPEGSYNINSDGLEKSRTLGYLWYNPIEYFDDVMQKYTSDNIIQFDHRRLSESDPIAVQALTVSYNLPDSINYNTDGEYSLVLQKHPGKSWGEKHQITVHINGTEIYTEVVLDRDKIITYKDGIIKVDNLDKRLDWIMDTVNKIPWNKI